jgi:phthiodiolone/phenolphthiodiolone dimycocerosates ketoreductase
VGCGETENTVPYGFDFSKPVARFEESLKVIRMLWESEGTIDFEGQFYKLHHARLDTEPYEGRFPKIWIGASGPRMLDITGRYADGWWPMGCYSPEEYATKLQAIRVSAERAGRDPMAIVPAFIWTCFIGDDAELAEILQAPLIKAWALCIPADLMRTKGFKHPMGEEWRGAQDINPGVLTRERVVSMLAKVDVESLLAFVPHGTPQQIARHLKGYVDAGLRVPKILDYGGMAGLKYGARSAEKVRQAEDELLRLVGENS